MWQQNILGLEGCVFMLMDLLEQKEADLMDIIGVHCTIVLFRSKLSFITIYVASVRWKSVPSCFQLFQLIIDGVFHLRWCVKYYSIISGVVI